MSQKVYDKKNRWRSKVVAFRVSPEEWEELEDKIKLCGYGTKQDYIIDCLFSNKIQAVGNPMMLTQFRKDFRIIRTELEEIQNADEISQKLIETIVNMENILVAFSESDEDKIIKANERVRVKIIRP